MSTRQLHNKRLAFAFPGVGVRLCGHEAGFLHRHSVAMAPTLDEASAFAGYEYVAHLTHGQPLDGMTELQGQLFTYAFDCAVATVYRQDGLSPALMAGHSMGIYSALVMADVVTFSAGLEIVREAYELVTEASQGIDAGMAVVVGLSRREVDEVLEGLGAHSSVCRVNANNDATTIFSGQRTQLEELIDVAKARDAIKARLLPVHAPYHHPGLLAGTSDRFAQSLRRYVWSAASCPIVSSIDQTLLTEPEELLDLTARNISTPISWERVVHTMSSCKIELIIECGAGISLRQNGRLMLECPPFFTIKNAERGGGI